MDKATEFFSENKKSYKGMSERSGTASIQASSEFQELRQAENIADTNQGKQRLNYTDEEGREKNLTQQVKNIQN